MIGTVGFMTNRIGGYSVIEKTDNNILSKLPAGSKILCTNCQLDQEDTLIANGNVLKTLTGYDILKDTDITIIKDSSVPLTILHGREFLYIENVKSDSNEIFNLPKGTRVNGILVENNGEFSITSSATYLIEY